MGALKKNVLSCWPMVNILGTRKPRGWLTISFLIILSNSMRSKLPKDAQLFLDTLVKIQEGAYAQAAARTARAVLQLHNLTWYHGILCWQVIGFKLKILTTRKFYGSYYHNVTTMQQSRIV